MNCKSPLVLIPDGLNPSGKPHYKIDHISSGVWLETLARSPTDSANGLKHLAYKSMASDFVKYGDPILVPCGKCIECRLQYARQWADRCMLELQSHESSYFLNLTYDPEHLPLSESVNFDTGEKQVHGTLVKKDFQDFMKRLRERYSKKYDNKLRFFAAGEYGSDTFRPHYHAIVFGLKLDDLVFYKYNELKQPLFNSEWLDSIWNKGYVVVGEVTWESCSYVARYTAKKVHNDMSQIYEQFNISPEFTLMSNRPGIGFDFFNKYKFRIYEHDYFNISTPQGGKRIYPPRYFDKLLDKEDPKLLESIKERRKFFSDQKETLQETLSTLSFEERLKIEERNKLNSVKILKRGDCYEK